MSEIVTGTIGKPRSLSAIVLQALAVIFVVIANAGGPAWLGGTAGIFAVPVLFVSVGYLYNEGYQRHPKAYLWQQMRLVYWPFWLWSTVFLVLHNLFFWTGLLNGSYGNAAGEVLQPYGMHDFMQRLWSITFNMSGYDAFLGEMLWFFRALFVGAIAFYVLQLLLPALTRLKAPRTVGWGILALTFVLLLWMAGCSLQLTGIAGGGYRELLALLFLCLGYLYRQYEHLMPRKALWGIAGFALLCLFAWLRPSTMDQPDGIVSLLALPLPVMGAFIALHTFAQWVAGKANWLTRGLQFIGRRSLYLLVFHLLAFKAVSIAKVLWYDLPWSRLGAHPVVHDYMTGDFFFIFYILLGVALPLLVLEVWRFCDKKYNLTWFNILRYGFQGLLIVLVFLKKIIINTVMAIWRSIVGFFRDLMEFIKASNPKDE